MLRQELEKISAFYTDKENELEVGSAEICCAVNAAERVHAA